MIYLRTTLVILLAAATFGTAFGQAPTLNPNLVANGSFENPKNTWMDTSCNYMSLLAGSTTIPHWTVTPETVNEIVWGMSPTCDNITAAAGKLFVDLSGFGGDSPNGTLTQTIKKLVAGRQYSFSVAIAETVPLVTVDGVPIALTAGKPFHKGSTTWIPENGSFTAQSASAVLTIQNPQPGAQIVFIDRVSIRAQ
jgi:hypothetical protein